MQKINFKELEGMSVRELLEFTQKLSIENNKKLSEILKGGNEDEHR